MEPNYFEEERVLTLNWIKPRVDDVLVFKQNSKFYVKRLKKISGRKLKVFGDNQKFSSKVRPIDFQQVVGRVILKY